MGELSVLARKGWLSRAWAKVQGKKGKTRYDTLREVFEHQVTNKLMIMEIGTYTGHTAASLINIARDYEPAQSIHYYGFDLFECLDGETLVLEMSKRSSRTMEEVGRFICQATGIPAENVHLFPGFTKDTLWKGVSDLPRMGFIFIDGGHSDETIEGDWRASQELMGPETVVVFDDLYHFDHGPRRIIQRLGSDLYNVEILEPQEIFSDQFGVSPDGVLRINMVKVTRKR